FRVSHHSRAIHSFPPRLSSDLILSLSFDPADTQAYLTRYAAGMRADANLWQFATLTDATQRKALLDTFGIIVIPAPYGQFEHNRSEEHTSELQSRENLVCRLLL